MSVTVLAPRSVDEVASYLLPGVIVVCEDSPSGVTLSGDVKPLEMVLASLKSESLIH